MGCEQVPLEGGGVAIVCGARGRSKRCRWCSSKATLLCDYPVAGGGKTCSAPMCAQHALERARDFHVCPEHRPDRQAAPAPSTASGPREPLQALTLWQPWASAIAAGAKVDPGLSRQERGYRFGRGWSMLRDLWAGLPGGRAYPRPRGYLGLVRYDVAEPFEPGSPCHDDPWCSGPWCWRVGRVILLPEPIAANGAQGLWNVPDELLPTFRELLRANPETR